MDDDASSTRSRGKGKKHAPSSHSQDVAEGSALILRVHHVLSDGLALVAFMDAITEEWYVRPHSELGRSCMIMPVGSQVVAAFT